MADALALARAYVAAPPLPEPRLTALGIADLNPANVLLHDGEVRLVDFEDGGLSDPAYELADHVEHLGSRLPGVYDVDALPAAVGLDAGDRAPDGGVPPPVRGVLAGDAPAGQRELATQPARHHRGAGRAFHGSRAPPLDSSVGAGPVARPRTP